VLARGLDRFTLYRSVRVMLYHHLAVLRHRQRRYGETMRICWALLSRPSHGLGDNVQRRVRLLLADACLHRGEPVHAHAALVPLYVEQLDLNDALQLLDLQTRYERMCGQASRMLHVAQRKVRLAELMPPEPAARIHRLLGEAAEMLNRPQTAAWLHERAALLHAADGSGLVTGEANG